MNHRKNLTFIIVRITHVQKVITNTLYDKTNLEKSLKERIKNNHRQLKKNAFQNNMFTRISKLANKTESSWLPAWQTEPN